MSIIIHYSNLDGERKSPKSRLIVTLLPFYFFTYKLSICPVFRTFGILSWKTCQMRWTSSQSPISSRTELQCTEILFVRKVKNEEQISVELYFMNQSTFVLEIKFQNKIDYQDIYETSFNICVHLFIYCVCCPLNTSKHFWVEWSFDSFNNVSALRT